MCLWDDTCRVIWTELWVLSHSTVDMKVKRPMAPVEIPLEPRSVHDEFSIFKPPEGEPKIRTSPQLLLATHRFLSRGLPALMWNDKLQEAVCYSDFTMVKGVLDT